MTRPDVLIVGAGIVGAACARELVMAGLQVEVLDACPPGGGATSAGMGHILVLDDSPAQLALTSWSRHLWLESLDAMPAAVEQDQCGTLWVAADAEELSALAARCSLYTGVSAAAEIVGAAQLAELEPCLRPGLAGAMLVPDDLVVYAPAATEWLLDEACARGARVRSGERVEAVESGAVRLSGGRRLEAGWVVNAAGDAAFGLLRRPVPGLAIRPRKGHLVISERVPGFCRHQLVEVGYLKSAHTLDESASVAFNLQPRPNGQVLVGSSRQLGRRDSRVDPGVLAHMLRRAHEFVPRLARLCALRAWTGLRAATDDKLPIIGPLADEPRLLLATGHEGLGITTSLATGRLVADWILDRTSLVRREAYGCEVASRGMLHG